MYQHLQYLPVVEYASNISKLKTSQITDSSRLDIPVRYRETIKSINTLELSNLEKRWQFFTWQQTEPGKFLLACVAGSDTVSPHFSLVLWYRAAAAVPQHASQIGCCLHRLLSTMFTVSYVGFQEQHLSKHAETVYQEIKWVI